MPVSVACEACGRKLNVSEKHIGKKAKCPGCGEQTWLHRPVDETRETAKPNDEDYDSYSTLPPISKAKPRPVPEVVETVDIKNDARKPTIAQPVMINAGIGVVCLVIGYFAGREHLKHQFATGLSQAAESFTTRLNDGVSPNTVPRNQSQAGTVTNVEAKKTAVREPIEKPSEPDPVSAAPVIPEMKIGEPYRTENFEIVLQGATIGPVPLRDKIRGDVGESENEQLMFQFGIKNVHDRKILTFSGDAQFGPQRFILNDDVDNRIRGVDFGFGSDVIGELKPADDMQPGEERTHIQVFTVPPKKTQQLTLTVDCSAFGADGTITFIIPATQIAGFTNDN